jgi:hypothetical protein
MSHAIRSAIVTAAASSAILALSAPARLQAEDLPAGPPAIGTWAFTYPHHAPSARAALDLRYLNEKEAGQSGFVRRTPDGNGFALGDGTPVRFWAVGSGMYAQPPDVVARHVRFLAKIGVNLVRLHAEISPKGKGSKINAVDQAEIGRIMRFVAAAKKEGIYTTISPYWANPKPAEAWGIADYASTTDLWGLLFFNETLQDAYKGWVRALYTQVNPATGIPLAQDPAVALIQIQNEDSLLFWTIESLRPAQKEILGKKFGAWLVKKYGSLDQARRAWNDVAHEDDHFERGRVGFFNVWHMTIPQTGGMDRRIGDQLQFYAETQHAFYADMVAFHRDTLGCRQLINASNWKSADPIRLEDVERWTYTPTDVIAVNRYYTGGSHIGENSGWQIAPGHQFSQQSALLDPRELPLNLKQVVGHPMILSESLWVGPLAYQSEGPFLVSVYQSLTGVDAFYWYMATDVEFSDSPQYKWLASSPAVMGGFPAAALMFRLGYIKQGEPVVHEERTLEGLWKRETPVIAEGRSFDPNRDRGHVVGSTELQAGVDPLAFLVGPVEVKFGGDPARTRVVDLSRYIDGPNKIVKSITGEVTLDHGKGLCTLDAPRAQGACGFLARAGVIALSDVAIRARNGYAAAVLVALDDRPLSSSRRILVQVVTSARPTGWKTRASEFPGEGGKTTVQGFQILQTGTPPYRFVNTEVGLVVRNPFLAKATLLDTAGYPVKEVAVTRARDDLSIQLPLNTMYLILE